MELLVETILEVLTYLPANVVNIAIIAYLLYFNAKHTKEHREILSRLSFSEGTDVKVDSKLDEIYMMALKTAITNVDLPVPFRLELYDVYKNAGGNSWVDGYVKENLLVRKPITHKRRKEDME